MKATGFAGCGIGMPSNSDTLFKYPPRAALDYEGLLH